MANPIRNWRSVPDDDRAIVVLIAAFTLLRLVLAATVPLLPQEAYYWTWSQYPDWSYFDHPPLASYGIALTTALFGQTQFGIKSAAVLWSLGWNLLWARLILDLYGDRRLAFWSLLALNLTLVYQLYGFGPTPDGPLLLFWVGTIWAVARVSASGDGRWWFVAGAFMGLSWLGKYSGALLAPVVFLYLLLSPAQRYWLRRPQPYLGLGLAVAFFAPVLVWNWQHEWASLVFQSSRRFDAMAGLKPRFFVVLLLTQLIMVSPYLFAVSLGTLYREVRRWLSRQLDDRDRLLMLSALVPLILFSAVSFRSNAKINWLVPVWWSLIILGMRYLLARPQRDRRLAWGLSSSAVVLALGLIVSTVPDLPVPGDLNSWSGWKEAATKVERLQSSARSQGHNTFVFSPNYKISSLIWFHQPGQPRTYAQDIYGERALQYDHFPRDSDLKGATGFLVLSDQGQSALDLGRLKPYFDSVERVELIETASFGRNIRRIEIYRCTNYRGRPTRPADPALRGAARQP